MAGMLREDKRNLIASERARGCLCCGHPDATIMEFHHVDRSEKLFSVASRKYQVSGEELLAELSKCVTLCPTCHVYADRGIYQIVREDQDDDHSSYVCRRPGSSIVTGVDQEREG